MWKLILSGSSSSIFLTKLVLLSAFHFSFGATQPQPRPPLITKQSATNEIIIYDESYKTGKDPNITLVCEADGLPPPQFRWTKDGRNFQWKILEEEKRISFVNRSGTLIFNFTQAEDAGIYQCFAYNKWGTATANPMFVREAALNSMNILRPSHFTISSGEPFRIRCNRVLESYPKPRLYWATVDIPLNASGIASDWSFNLEDSRNITNSSRITPDPEGTLWFARAELEDNGFVYGCVADFGFRTEVYQIFKLDVVNRSHNDVVSPYRPWPQYPMIGSGYTIAIRGTSATFWCIVGGQPLPTLTWSRKIGTLKLDDRVELTNYGKTLVILNVDFEDEGDYVCTASNSEGSYSNSYKLQVRTPPHFILEPQIQNAALGENVQFSCEAGGEPSPEIRWILNGNFVEEKDYDSRRIMNGSTITIENVTKEDVGNYGCNATNMHGFVYKEVYLNIDGIEDIIGINVTENRGGVGADMVPKSNGWFVSLVAISAITVLVFVIGLTTIIIIRLRRKVRLLSKKEEDEFYNGTKGVSTMMETEGEDYLSGKFNLSFEIAKREFTFSGEQRHILGMGNFGIVYQDVVRGVRVAVKLPHENCSKETFRSFLCEVKVLSHLGSDPNVIRFVGCYTKEIGIGVIYIATELCERGSLQTYLRSELGGADGDLGETEMLVFGELLRFSLEIARGMEYISQQKVVHGDLSTRNVLLDGDLTCKIGDFGLSRKLYEYTKYVKESQEPLPWRWLAYESLMKMEFTTKSDAWSYGVTLWEIFSLGGIPYPGLAWSVDFTENIRQGLRMSCPRLATKEIFETMKTCWNLDPGSRPSFLELQEFLQHYRHQIYYTEL